MEKNFEKPVPGSQSDLQDLVDQADTGGRNSTGRVKVFIAGVALIWSVFQFALASPLANQLFPSDLINNSRQVHLSFAIFLAFLAFPAFKYSRRDVVPLLDWVLAICGAFVALYGFIFFDKIVKSGGLADSTDAMFAMVGLLILFEASRRTLGPAMPVIATVFMLYVFFGSSEWVPDVVRWRGASLVKAMSHMWTTSEGVFGIALGVSTRFVFLFVLFGALLEKAGAGNYFIQIAFGALGGLRGGPAKAAVVGSAATGLISGSSIANVVTTGTFTIPLMKRVGLSPEEAGAVEVASSVNGQLMPPVMGAAAFLMVEFVGIPYSEVIMHAFLPAAISYIALVYIVHLGAVKRNLPILGTKVPSLVRTVLGTFAVFSGFTLVTYIAQYPIAAISRTGPGIAPWLMVLITGLIYVGLLYFASREDDLTSELVTKEYELPDIRKIYKTGLYYLLPIFVLVYLLMIEKKSPGLSAFWASSAILVILATQRPLKAYFRGSAGSVASELYAGVADTASGMIAGARNMIAIGVATATAGVIVGTVTLTGIGQVMSELVEYVSGGNLIAMLLFVAVLSLILGMGLPTTANYIVVSSLLAGVVVELGAQSGLIVPLISVHLFVFYFGIMADVTPPVGLASFAAAAVAGGDAIKTGVIAFFYSLRTVVLPFMFIFNTDLLLIDVGFVEGLLVFLGATAAVLVFTAGTMGYFVFRSTKAESVALVLIAFFMFRPDILVDQIQPPYSELPVASVLEGDSHSGDMLISFNGPDFYSGKTKSVSLMIAPGESDKPRLATTGLRVAERQSAMQLDEPFPGSTYFETFKRFDFYGAEPVTVERVRLVNEQMPSIIMVLPSLFLLALIALRQRSRSRRFKDTEAAV